MRKRTCRSHGCDSLCRCPSQDAYVCMGIDARAESGYVLSKIFKATADAGLRRVRRLSVKLKNVANPRHSVRERGAPGASHQAGSLMFPAFPCRWPHPCYGESAEVDGVTTGRVEAGANPEKNRHASNPRGCPAQFEAAELKRQRERRQDIGLLSTDRQLFRSAGSMSPQTNRG